MQRLLAAILTACVLIPATPALARHHHHRHRHLVALQQEIIVCNDRGCSDHAKRVIPENTAPAARKVRAVQKRIVQVASHWAADGSTLISKARGYLGMSARQIGLHRRTLWCAAFIRYLGVKGPVDDRAISFNHLPHVAPQIGAIAVYPHHVGIVTGWDGNWPIIISGNSYGRRVYEGTYRRRPIAYVSASL